MSERAMLMRLVEAAETVEPDWQDALRRAGFVARYRPRLRPRRVLVLALVLLGVLYAVAAFAADEPGWSIRYWLFDRSPETYPSTQAAALGEWRNEPRMGLDFRYVEDGVEPLAVTIPVLEAEVAGRRFELQVYPREWRPGAGNVLRRWVPGASVLCLGLEPGGTPKPYHATDIPSFAGGGCPSPVHGLGRESDDTHWVGTMLAVAGPIEPTGGGTGPKYLFGPAAPTVRHVDLESRDGTVVRVATFAGPPDIGVRVRLWVAVLRLEHLVHTIVPRDEEGEALERWHLRWAY